MLLVSQDEPRIEIQRRLPDGLWSIADLAGLEATLELADFEIRAPLAEIYRRVR